MAKLIALYHAPSDPAAFDTYYRETHTPLARKVPGLRSFEVSSGTVMTPEGPSPYHLVAILGFDSMSDLQNALGSAEGRAMVADLRNFATGGVTPLIFATETP